MAELTVEEQKKQDAERRRLLLALLLLLATDTHEHLVKQATAYLSGSTPLIRAGLSSTLLGAHTHAVWLGRRLAGVSHPIDEQDQQFAQAVMAGQAAFLVGLTNDMATGRYALVDGELPAALVQRIWLYCVRLRGTANDAWRMALPPDTMLDWVLGEPETRHCETCPQRAAEGPYRAGTVGFDPGDGTSECGVLCLCEWQIVDGDAAFPLLGARP